MAAFKTHPGVPSCGQDPPGAVQRVPPPGLPGISAGASCLLTPSELCQPAQWGFLRPCSGFSELPLQSPKQEGSHVASGSPLETFFESLRDSVAEFTARFTRSVFYKVT